MKRTGPIRRRKPLARVNRERRRRQYTRAFGPEGFVEWTRKQPCVVCGAVPSECAHVRSRGAGGTWEDVVSLCRSHHREQHNLGVETFQLRHALPYLDVLARLHNRKWVRAQARAA
jgi:hypothetical protein